jgi:ComF family protein
MIPFLMFQTMLNSVLNLFFPKTCSGCQGLLLQNETLICTACRHELPLTNHHLNLENEMFKKFYGRIPILYASSLFYFNKKGIVQELIHNLKYRGHQEIGQTLGNWYAEDLKTVTNLKTVDYIVTVPLHQQKLKERGYNQLTTFGETLSQNLAIPYDATILIRNSYTKTQSQKNLEDRMQGMNAVFEAVFSEQHHNKHFLLLDDVITTGTTLESCCRALEKIPNAKISIVCMAMTQ